MSRLLISVTEFLRGAVTSGKSVNDEFVGTLMLFALMLFLVFLFVSTF